MYSQYTHAYGFPKSDITYRTRLSASAFLPLTPQFSANMNRQQICFMNTSTTVNFYLVFGQVPVSSSDYTVVLKPGDYYEIYTSVDSIAVFASSTSLTDILVVTEMV